MKEPYFQNPINKLNYSSKKTNIMKYMNFLSKLTGILLFTVVAMQNAAAFNNPTPYQQLQTILNGYYIEKNAVTDELTATELERISPDVALQFKVPENVFENATTIGELLTHILKHQYSKKRGPEWDWRKVQYSSDPHDYESYLLSYSKSKHNDEIMSKYMVIRLYEEFLKLDEADSLYEEACHEYLYLYLTYVNYYDSYIRHYECDRCGISGIDYEGFSRLNPEQWADHIRKQLQERSEERQAWKAVLRENTHDAYWNYCLKYPFSPTINVALERIKEFEQAEWDKATRKGNREAYETFVRQFPQGIYSLEAYRKITHSHIDTTSSKAVDNALVELCEFDRPDYSLIGIANINIEEKTYTITLSGDLGYRMILKPGEFKWLEVMDGEYEILVEADGVRPWWGVTSCSGHLYIGAWYVITETKFHIPIQQRNPLFTPFDLGNSTVSESQFEETTPDNNPNVDQKAMEHFIKAVSNQCDEY